MCNKLLSTYYWQKPIMNEERYNGFYSTIGREIKYNPFLTLDKNGCESTFKRCQDLKKFSWTVKKIKDKRNNIITDIELLAIKLYTDYSHVATELRKCYRKPPNQKDITQYEMRYGHIFCLYCT